ncbi:reverse transcriptase domain-containing protein [Tanacetum coccineum]
MGSPDFNLLSDKEYSEEEEEEAMAETMEQYISKTQTDYGSGVARPKIDNKYQFELKEQFLKELRENTFSGSDNEDANKHLEKVLEIVDLFHVPNITMDKLILRVFPISLTGATSRWLRNEPTGSIKTWEDLKIKFLNKYYPPGRTDVILFYNGLDVLTRQILGSRGAILTKTATDAKTTIQEMSEYSKKWNNGTLRGRSIETSDGLAVIQAQLNNIGREIKKVNEKSLCCSGGGYRATAPGYYQRNNANPSFQE